VTQASPPESEPSQELVGRVLAERFRVEALIGSGAMGSVYRALHVHTRKQVAIKLLHRELTGVEEVVARFEREAVAAGRVEHPNVASALDFGRLEDGTFYLVLEYVAGRRLRSALSDGPLAPERAASIARQVALGLGAAHAAGVVHRDLKPDNVMLLDRDGSDWVKVLDFGVAKVSTDAGAAQLTRLGTIIGTPDYMSPEQALGNAVDHRADLYALGVMLYEMLTGRTPFAADDVTQVLMAQITQPPEALPSSVPAKVRTLVERLLAKDPADRLQSAAETVTALEAVLTTNSAPPPASEPLSYAIATSTVTPPSTESATGRRRFPRAIWIGGAALLVVLAFVVTLSMTREVAAPLLGSSQTGPRLRDVAGGLPSSAPTATAPEAPQAEPAASGVEVLAPPAAKPAAAGKPAKPQRKPQKPQKPQKRRTGPGGIYIPPPSEWF
jgi:eukaryotic-like serine/threonine-protein kinase